MPPSLLDLVVKKKVLVILGPGGVGKTTSSIGIAVHAAMQGKRVGLLSIDPAKRLASALGLSLTGKTTPVHFDEALPGSLEAAMLDQKAMFDHMVHRYAKSPSAAEAILRHPLYKASSMHLSGSVEYMALARLQEMVDDHRYDLVILDTPPDGHALDFLARPGVLSRFREQKVMTWLIKPFLLAAKLGIGRLMNLSEKLMGGVAQVTGFKALQSFGEFLVLIQQVIDGFHSASESILHTLHQQSTGFLLVTAPTAPGIRTGLALGTELAKIGYPLDGVVLNRYLPEALRLELDALAESTGNAARQFSPFLSQLMHRKINEQQVCNELLQKLGAVHKHEMLSLAVEEKDYSIHNPSSVYRFAKSLAG